MVMHMVNSVERRWRYSVGACFSKMVWMLSSPGDLFFIFLSCVWISAIVTGLING